MRRILLHRRAVKALRGFPSERQAQIVRALEDLAAVQSFSNHPNVKALSGEFEGWSRLRIGPYRAIFQIRLDESVEVLWVDYIGLRGSAY